MANKLSLLFEVLAQDKASQPLSKVGDAADKAGAKIEKGSERGRRSFGLMASTLVSSSQGALGPIGDLTDRLGVFTQALESAGSRRSGQLLGVGLAATAAGGFLQGIVDKDKQALQQLEASVDATGHSFSDYKDELEKAAQSGAKFGDDNAATADALNRLVLATHNPETAIKGLSVAFDVAAAKHISLADASTLVGQAFNGTGRLSKQLGLQLENTSAATAKLTAAQKAARSANDAVAAAQKSYAEKLDLWNNSSTKTRAQAYALADAHEKLIDSQKKAAATADAQRKAQKDASDAAEAGARNLDKVSKLVAGQAAASANSLSGEFRKFRAEIENTLGQQGTLAKGLEIAGPAMSGLALLAQVTLVGRMGKAMRLSAAAAAESAAEVDTALASEGTAAEASAAAIVESSATASTAMEAEGTAAATSAGKFGLLAKVGGNIAWPVALAAGARDLTDALVKDGKSRGGVAGALESVAGKAQNFVNNLSGAGQAVTVYKEAVKLLGGQAEDTAKKIDLLAYAEANATDIANNRRARDAGSDNPLTATRAQGGATGNVTKILAAAKPPAAKAGKDTGDAYLKGLLDQLKGQDAAKAASDAAKAVAQALVDAAQKQFDAAKGRLQGLVSASLNLRQAVTQAVQGGSALTDIFQGPDLNANNAFGPQRRFGQVRDFLAKRLAQEKRFVTELRDLMKLGLDPTLVAQIASAGVDGGHQIAEAILSGGKGGVGQVNGVERQIASIANGVGKTVADDKYAKTIAEQRRTTEVLGHKLDIANAHLAKLDGKTLVPTASAQRTASALTGV